MPLVDGMANADVLGVASLLSNVLDGGVLLVESLVSGLLRPKWRNSLVESIKMQIFLTKSI